METDYNKPHHVLLLFNKARATAIDEPVIKEHQQYYKKLQDLSIALLSGNFWNQHKSFVIVWVSSDIELQEIIDHDPGLKQGSIKLVRAMPFCADPGIIVNLPLHFTKDISRLTFIAY